MVHVIPTLHYTTGDDGVALLLWCFQSICPLFLLLLDLYWYDHGIGISLMLILCKIYMYVYVCVLFFSSFFSVIFLLCLWFISTPYLFHLWWWLQSILAGLLLLTAARIIRLPLATPQEQVFSVYNQQQSALNEDSLANIALQCKQSGNMTDCTCTSYPDIISHPPWYYESPPLQVSFSPTTYSAHLSSLCFCRFSHWEILVLGFYSATSVKVPCEFRHC